MQIIFDYFLIRGLTNISAGIIFFYMDTGSRLKQILEKEGVSVRQLGRALDIDNGYLSKVINNTIQPSCKWIEKVFDYLGYIIEIKKKGGATPKKKK